MRSPTIHKGTISFYYWPRICSSIVGFIGPKKVIKIVSCWYTHQTPHRDNHKWWQLKHDICTTWLHLTSFLPTHVGLKAKCTAKVTVPEILCHLCRHATAQKHFVEVNDNIKSSSGGTSWDMIYSFTKLTSFTYASSTWIVNANDTMTLPKFSICNACQPKQIAHP